MCPRCCMIFLAGVTLKTLDWLCSTRLSLQDYTYIIHQYTVIGVYQYTNQSTFGMLKRRTTGQLVNFKDIGATVQTKSKGSCYPSNRKGHCCLDYLLCARLELILLLTMPVAEFEFSAAPPSNFHPDGSMIMLSDKSKLVSAVMNLPFCQRVRPSQTTE